MIVAALPRLSRIEAAATAFPWVILAYFAAQFVLRILISPNLETDEAQFVGQTHFALGYNNSHPPLYNWLVAAALWLTGGHWVAALALVKNAFLAGTYYLAYDLTRRVTGGAVMGMIAALCFLFLPQIVWKSQITLAHSVMLMFGVVGVLHAVVLIVRGGGLRAFVWLGIAASIGALAKYNFFLALAAIMAAAFSVGAIREKLLRPRLLISWAILIAAFAPHFFWALDNRATATDRIAKLERDNPLFGWLDVPYIGVDGLLSAFVAAVAWAGPLILACWVIWQMSPRAGNDDHGDTSVALPLRTFFGRAALFGYAAFLVILLAADLHYVHERYLTALLLPLPFWLVLRWPLQNRRLGQERFTIVAAGLAALMLTAGPVATWAGFDRTDYGAAAASVRQRVSGPLSVHATQQKFAANLAINFEPAHVWDGRERPAQILALWRDAKGNSETVPAKLLAPLAAYYRPAQEAFLALPASPEGPAIRAQLYILMP